MKANATTIFRGSWLLMALGLTACGGGGSGNGDSASTSACTSTAPGLCAVLNPGTGNGTGGGSTPAVALFTTAPSAVTLISDSSATYAIGGGSPPYSATSGNTSVVTVTVSGSSLTLKSLSQGGPVPVAIVDSQGRTVTLNVNVISKGQGTAPTIFPAAINAGDCTTNIPFVVTGGTAPFTVITSDNFGVPVSSALALPLGEDSYFTASIRNPRPISFPYTATVTVLDGQSRTASSRITIDHPRECPKNEVIVANPASGNARLTNILSFQISGSLPPYEVVSSDGRIATAVVVPPSSTAVPPDNLYTVNVKAEGIIDPSPFKPTSTALITVKGADKQQVNIVFTVLPQLTVR